MDVVGSKAVSRVVGRLRTRSLLRNVSVDKEVKATGKEIGDGDSKMEAIFERQTQRTGNWQTQRTGPRSLYLSNS
jgi:hypothetical protein